MRDCHDSPCDGHLNMRKPLELIKYQYWWLCMGKDVPMCLNAFLVRPLTCNQINMIYVLFGCVNLLSQKKILIPKVNYALAYLRKWAVY